ncbi:MAG: biopolymer transporter ExbD [Ignavibacteriaceae bacterium]|nr:biopolymer transporter ExbD [Ignavibacteriaceae bacterium]
MKFQTSKQPISIFSYSSLTDIVMLLVVFFLLTSQFVIQTGVKVKLPSSKLNERSEPTMMIVTLTSGGGVYVGSDEVGIDQLAFKLGEIKAETNGDNLIIRSDKSVSIEMIIKVIDAAKASAIDKFTIETEKQL